MPSQSGTVEASASSVVMVTAHAVARFRARVAPEMTEPEAREFLEYQVARGHFVKLTRDGIEQWRGPKPMRLRLRIHQGRLITVLPSSDRWIEPCAKMQHGQVQQIERQDQQEKREEVWQKT